MSTMQDEIIIDTRTLREKAVSWRKSAAHNIKIGLDATVHGLGVTKRALFRNGFSILIVLASIAVAALLVWVAVLFYVWLFHVAPVVFWLLIAFNAFNLIAALASMLSR